VEEEREKLLLQLEELEEEKTKKREAEKKFEQEFEEKAKLIEARGRDLEARLERLKGTFARSSDPPLGMEDLILDMTKELNELRKPA